MTIDIKIQLQPLTPQKKFLNNHTDFIKNTENERFLNPVLTTE